MVMGLRKLMIRASTWSLGLSYDASFPQDAGGAKREGCLSFKNGVLFVAKGIASSSFQICHSLPLSTEREISRTVMSK
jgi:hypothetical protein